MTETERIDFLIRHLEGGNAKAFSQRLGIDPSAVSRMRNKLMSLSEKYINIILDAYPQVSRGWLETGDGYPGDLSVELVKTRYEQKIERADRIIDSLTKEIERQGKIIDLLIAEKEDDK